MPKLASSTMLQVLVLMKIWRYQTCRARTRLSPCRLQQSMPMSTAEELRECVRPLIQPCQDRVKVAAHPRKRRAKPWTCVKVVMEGNGEETRDNTETYRARVAVAVDATERRAELLAHTNAGGVRGTPLEAQSSSAAVLVRAVMPTTMHGRQHLVRPSSPRADL